MVDHHPGGYRNAALPLVFQSRIGHAEFSLATPALWRRVLGRPWHRDGRVMVTGTFPDTNRNQGVNLFGILRDAVSASDGSRSADQRTATSVCGVLSRFSTGRLSVRDQAWSGGNPGLCDQVRWVHGTQYRMSRWGRAGASLCSMERASPDWRSTPS